MADYAALADLEALLPMVTISGTGTEPTDTQATGYLTLITAEMNGVLAGRGYTLPVSDADALAYLKTVCLYGAAAMVLRAKNPTTPDVDAAYRTAYREALEDIRSGRVLVPDAATDESTIGEGFTTNSEGEAYVPSVTLETEY